MPDPAQASRTCSDRRRPGRTRCRGSSLELVRPYRHGLVIVFARDDGRNADEPRGAVAAQGRPRQRARRPPAAASGSGGCTTWASLRTRMGLALFAALATIVIAVLGAIATTSTTTTPRASGSGSRTTCACASTTTSTGCRSATTPRTRPARCCRRSPATSSTVQDFASSATLSILVDMMTIVGMLGMMFWLNWDFALIAVGVTPFLLLFVMRFKKAVKTATREVRKRQSEIVAVVAAGAGVDARPSRRSAARTSRATRMDDGEPRDRRRRAAGAAREVAAVAGGDHRRRALHGVRAVARRRADARRRDDGRRADGVPRLPRQVLQAGAGPGEDDQHDRADGGRARAHPDDPRGRRRSSRRSPTRTRRRRSRARSRSSTSRSRTTRDGRRCCAT